MRQLHKMVLFLTVSIATFASLSFLQLDGLVLWSGLAVAVLMTFVPFQDILSRNTLAPPDFVGETKLDRESIEAGSGANMRASGWLFWVHFSSLGLVAGGFCYVIISFG